MPQARTTNRSCNPFLMYRCTSAQWNRFGFSILTLSLFYLIFFFWPGLLWCKFVVFCKFANENVSLFSFCLYFHLIILSTICLVLVPSFYHEKIKTYLEKHWLTFCGVFDKKKKFKITSRPGCCQLKPKTSNGVNFSHTPFCSNW